MFFDLILITLHQIKINYSNMTNFNRIKFVLVKKGRLEDGSRMKLCLAV